MRRAAPGLLLAAVALVAVLALGSRRGGEHAAVRPVTPAAARPLPAAPVGRDDEQTVVVALGRTARMVLRETAACPDARLACQRITLGRAATASGTLARFAFGLQTRATGRCRARVMVAAVLAGGMAQVAHDIAQEGRPGTDTWAAGRRAIRRSARRMASAARVEQAHPACARAAAAPRA